MEIRAAVVGAGSWGTTVANLLAHNVSTTLWARDPEVVRTIEESHRNERYLPDHDLLPSLTATTDLIEAVSHADVVVMGVPSHGFRTTLEQAVPGIRPWVPVISLAKGLEQGTQKRMTEIVNEVMPGHPYGVLTGPNLAKEILAGSGAATVLAMSDPTIAEQLQSAFVTDSFRVYTNDDIVGCEIAGALKNIMAIASGMADGLGTGDNTRAAVITRGLAELSRLGVAMGGSPLTFSGLAGMGDLVATCISPQSRNRHVGEQLGRGRTIESISDEMHMVAEGVKTAPVVIDLARRYEVEMPIAEQVYRVLYDGMSAADAYHGLLTRPQTSETYGLDSTSGPDGAPKA